MTWVDLWPTVSLISWMGRRCCSLMETAVSALVGVPVADARFPGHLGAAPVERVGCTHGAVLATEHEVGSVPGFHAFAVLPGFCALRAAMARFGRISERLDLRVLVSPVLPTERQTWTTPPVRSTWSQASLRSSPGRRPSVIDSTTSASSRRLSSAVPSMPICERHEASLPIAL